MEITFFSEISWSQFLLVFFLVSTGWILWVYKDAFISLSRPPDGIKRSWQPIDQPTGNATEELPPFDPDNGPPETFSSSLGPQQEEEMDDEFSQMDQLIDKLEILMIDQRGENDNNNVMTALQELFARYPALNKEPFKPAIHNYIIKLAQKNTATVIDDKELEKLWS